MNFRFILTISLCFIIFTLPVCHAQNLVINGSFEQFTACPTSVAQVPNATGWSVPSDGSPEYFNTCANFASLVGVPTNYWGYQLPKTGNAYVGLNLIYYTIPDFREYVQGSLSAPLVANNTYMFQMYVNKANNSQNSTDAFGVYFSKTQVSAIPGYAPLSFTPQIINATANYITDTTNWVAFSAPYKATGGEQFFMIGNYKNDINTSTINTNPGGAQSNGYVYFDDVSLTTVTGIEERNSPDRLRVDPNPFSNQLVITNLSAQAYEIKIYDVSNQIVLVDLCEFSKIINTERLSAGLYFYEVYSADGQQVQVGKLLKQLQ